MQYLVIFCFGVVSGLPFLLLLATLGVWLAEVGVTKTQLGLCTWVTLPYVGKFLLAPYLSVYKVPILTKLLGQKRAWIFVLQLGLVLALLFLSQTQPERNLSLVLVAALVVAIFAAAQDIVLDAYRIDSLASKQLAYGTMLASLGYRLGMFISGAGAIYLAYFLGSWSRSYMLMAGLVAGAMLVNLVLAREPAAVAEPEPVAENFVGSFTLRAITQFKHSFPDWFLLILLVLFFKFIDTSLQVMLTPFLLELGFSKLALANVAKSFGIAAMMLGTGLGGWLLHYYGLFRLIILGLGLQVLTTALFGWQAAWSELFSWQAQSGVVWQASWLLYASLGFANLVAGLNQVVLGTYLARLCAKPYTAVQFAILTSLGSLFRLLASSSAGWLADKLAWSEFFYALVLVAPVGGYAVWRLRRVLVGLKV